MGEWMLTCVVGNFDVLSRPRNEGVPETNDEGLV
jgi:hypothetical protein